MIDDGVWGPLYGLQLASCYQSSPVQAFGLGRNGFSPNRNCWGPLLRRKRNAPGGMGGTRLRSWGPAEFGWLARGFGAGGPRSLDGWHAALELGPAEFGWVARGFGVGARGVWMGGTRLWSWGPVEFGWLARGSGAGGFAGWGAEFGWLARGSGPGGGPRSLDGWHAAQELGVRGVWMDGTRLRSWARGFGWWRTAQELGGPRNLDGWHAANALGFNMMSHSNCSGCCGGR